LLGFLTVTGVQVALSVDRANELDRFATQVKLGREINTLVHELQRERDRTAGALAALRPAGADAGSRSLADVAPDRTAVDRAAVALEAAARPLRTDAIFDQAYQNAATGLAELPRVRDGAQSGWLREPAVFDAFTQVIAGLQALLSVPAAVAGDATLGQDVEALADVSRVKELTAQIRGLLYAAGTAGSVDTGELEAVADVRAQQRATIARFRTESSAPQIAAFDEAVSGQAVRNASRLEQSMVDNLQAGGVGVDAEQWWQASTTQLELMRGAEQRSLDTAIAAAERRSAAQQRSVRYGTLASVLLLLVTLLTSLLIGRTMVRTLRSLRAQALDIAHRRLPEMIEQLRAAPRTSIHVEPVAIESRDEVGEVAEAFTAVHRSAVRLAAEQAQMRHNVNAVYVNLARRSQTLVERQLALLDALESAESDPQQLANLFRLDHLATRMRRNDDNLLVLAGGDVGRRWTEPVPLASVVLAAAAEIEDYHRVRHDITDNIHIAGHVVADLVHLVAELLENATVFSPPDTTVSVLGWVAEGGAAVVIQDEGMGMSAEAVRHANRQIAGPVSIDVAAAERMGLVVVGHLAHRHGIRAEVRTTDRGVAVMVLLPTSLLAEPPVQPPALPAGFAGRLQTALGSTVDAVERPEPAEPAQAAAARRTVPTRAEDVLGAGRVDSGGLWWSRQPTPAASAKPAISRQPSASSPSLTGAGLPKRVPMEHLPPLVEATPVQKPREPNPQEMGSVLSRFYGGVHRAAAEDDNEDLQAVT
jgi:hypothetical protein